MNEREKGFVVRDEQGNIRGAAFQGLRTWLPGPDTEPFFGLDRSGGIQRKFRAIRWARFVSWWRGLFRKPRTEPCPTYKDVDKALKDLYEGMELPQATFFRRKQEP